MNSLSINHMNILINFKTAQLFKIWLVFSSLLFISACQSPENSNQQHSLADGMASLTVSIPGISSDGLAAQKNQRTLANRVGVPTEVTSLLIEVLNDANEVLDSAEVIGTEGTVILTIEAGDNYTIRGSAYAATELLFQGESIIPSLKAGSSSSVSLTLQDQIQLSLTSPGDIEIGVGATTINFNLSGLNDLAINWYVNGILGGSAEVGFIDANGQYSPPAVLPTNPTITIMAEPVVSPYFAQSFTLQLLPPDNINNSPIANASVDQTVSAGATVILSAANSSDTDGTIVSYSWVQVSEDVFPVMNNMDQLEASFVAPSLSRDSVVIVELTVTDDDGATDIDSITVLIQQVPNVLPQANAGADQTVLEESLLTLNGSASSDSDGTIDEYSWIQTGGLSVTLSSAIVASPTFTSPTVTANTQLTFELTVTDNGGTVDTDSVVITVQPVNADPTANAGVDQTVNAAVQVNMTAAASSDSDGSIETYNWTLLSDDLTPTLNNATTITPSFTAPSVQYGGFATFGLTVTDNEGATDSDEITILVNGTDQPLVSNAGLDQVVNENTLVTLDGSASTDPDNAITTYLWEELSNGGITLSDTSAQSPTFTAPDIANTTVYQFRLTVTNDHGDQAQDDVSISVNNVAVLATKVYFAASSDFSNHKLWVTDGTEVGTQQVAAVEVSNQEINNFKTIGDSFYFSGIDGVNGRELWKTDGTLAGTEILPSADDSAYVGEGASANADPSAFAVLNDTLLYRAVTSSVNGSNRVSEYLSLETGSDNLTVVSTSGVSSYYNYNVGVFDGFSYFYNKLTTPIISTTLYKSDGINSAIAVKTFLQFDDIHDFIEVNGELFFIVGSNELWKSDGTEPGTVQLKVFSGIAGTTGNFNGSKNAVAYNNNLYFVADDGEGRELWMSDGTIPGTVLVKDLDLTVASTNPTEFTVLNGSLLFLSSEAGGATDGIWQSDGTTLGTQRLVSLSVNTDVGFYAGSSTGVSQMVDSLGLVFFSANDGVNGNELWVTDGTVPGTQMVMDINPGGNSEPAMFRQGDGFLLFSAQDADLRAKLWKTDGTEAGTELILDINPGGFDNAAFFQLAG